MRSLALVLLAGCASTTPKPAPANLPSTNHASMPPVQAPPQQTLFAFHVGFWVNLHQRLFAESSPRRPAELLRAATPEDQATWDAALDFYRRRWPERHLLTLLENDELARLNRTLGELEAAADLLRANVSPEVRATLESAAAVYRRAGWDADAAADHDFIARVSTLTATHGAALATALARAYQTPWPTQPVRVDVARYAGPVGAYTIDTITIASRDPRHAGDAALEALFHEASHLLIDRDLHQLAEACRAQHVMAPPQLWHALLFFTVGELTLRELGGAYVPYAQANGLWQRSPDWSAWQPLLEQTWTPFLDGKTDAHAALDALAAALPK